MVPRLSWNSLTPLTPGATGAAARARLSKTSGADGTRKRPPRRMGRLRQRRDDAGVAGGALAEV